ncbi:MAG: hypothetical protein JST85_00005, partial [Acidobacteria bacterium]|nr:hypothetical protein [Acidobacteriota bacterium]
MLPSPVKTSAGGISSEAARRLLMEHGFNEPVAQQKVGIIRQFLRFFANPLVVILLIASGISAAAGD